MSQEEARKYIKYGRHFKAKDKALKKMSHLDRSIKMFEGMKTRKGKITKDTLKEDLRK